MIHCIFLGTHLTFDNFKKKKKQCIEYGNSEI